MPFPDPFTQEITTILTPAIIASLLFVLVFYPCVCNAQQHIIFAPSNTNGNFQPVFICFASFAQYYIFLILVCVAKALFISVYIPLYD